MPVNSEGILRSINPANKECLGELRRTSPKEVLETIEAASRAQLFWAAKKLEERLEFIEEFRLLLFAEQDSLAELICLEMGKPKVEALVSEIFAVLETCQWLSERAEEILADRPVSLNPIFFAGKSSYNRYEPKGVVAVISPWNYPFSIPATSMLLALCAGNAVVLKPSPKGALVAAKLVELFNRAGFPLGLVGLVQGDKEQAENLILGGVAKVVFTGSLEGGKAIMAIAARELVPVTLELGGKHPAIILADAELATAVPALCWSAFTNCGQACASVDRLYVPQELLAKVLPMLGQAAQALRLGSGLEENCDLGPVVDERQFKRLKELLDDACAKGAKIISGGKTREDLGGFFLEPTVLTDISPQMRIANEEIFGPILPVVAYESLDQVIGLANSSNLGLAASVWTGDLAAGEAVAERLQVGVVWVNDALYSHVCPDAPWGGIKQSGFGKAHGEEELLALVNLKNVGISAQGKRDWHYPYGKKSADYVRAGVQLLHGSFGDKLAALKALAKIKLGIG